MVGPVVLRALRECPDCGQMHRVPPVLPRHGAAQCLRCDGVLRRSRANPLTRPLALAVAGLMLLAAALITPMLTMRFYGLGRQAAVLTGARVLGAQGTWALSAVVFLTVAVLPALRLGALTLVLGGLRLSRPPPGLRLAFRLYERIAPWSMIEVFLIGVMVAYSQAASYGRVQVGTALYLLGALVLVMVTLDASLDAEAVWQALARACPPAREPLGAPARGRVPIACPGCRLVSLAAADGRDRCQRCRHRLRRRKPNSLARGWALIGAATILYVPANVFPVMTLVYLGRGAPRTILGGVEELINRRLWPLAAIIFLASITVPLLKLVSLSVMMLNVHFGWAGLLRDRTRLYRMVSAIGRWSMIDVFVLSALVALVRMGIIASVHAQVGAVAFAAVVILTMLAAESFDPRLMWDAAATPRRRALSPEHVR
ncbi:MAG: PqiA/YebS family transporter subunit [Acetobacteraceae bacterium]|nr:PqiA/YebS family transporter subunit [Acetobacteraceae bacterium]